MSNYIRSLLFQKNMNFVELIVLLLVVNKLPFWAALLAYLGFCWIVEPLIAAAVGASPADLAEIDAKKTKYTNLEG